MMNSKLLMTWFSVVSVILVLVGAFFAVFGLGVLPVNKDVLLQWESAIYGAIMIGWGATLLYAGRLAFRRNDIELMKILLVGLAAWLILEALFSSTSSARPRSRCRSHDRSRISGGLFCGAFRAQAGSSAPFTNSTDLIAAPIGSFVPATGSLCTQQLAALFDHPVDAVLSPRTDEEQRPCGAHRRLSRR